MLLNEYAEVYSGKLLSRYDLEDTTPDDPESIYVLNNGSTVSRGSIIYHGDQWKTVKGMKKMSALKRRERKTSFLADAHDVIIKPTAPSYVVYIDEETAKKGILVSSAFLIVKCSEQKLEKMLMDIREMSGGSRIVTPGSIQISYGRFFERLVETWKEALSKYICVYLSMKFEAKETEGTNQSVDRKTSAGSKTDEESTSNENTPVRTYRRELIRANELRLEDIPLFSEPIDSPEKLQYNIEKMNKAYEIFMESNIVIQTLDELKKAELRRMRLAILGEDDRCDKKPEENNDD